MVHFSTRRRPWDLFVPETSPTSSDPELRALVERVLSASYALDREVGRGGMGIVYGAKDKRLKRTVAIKILPPELSFRSEIRTRFLREAETAAQLNHPHIVPIYSVDEAEGLVYFVMACVDGDNLGKRIHERGPLPIDDARRILAEVADALAYAHARGVVHRDVKPDNILFDEDGHALVTDFGIATARFHGRLTNTGRAMGTPHYMSPEQAMGKMVDGRSDVYALGVVLYEVLAGAPPFDGPDAYSVGYKHVHEAPVPLEEVDSRIPAAIARVVMRCLLKSPAERYATAAELAEALIAAISAMGSHPGALEAARLATIARLPGRHSGQPVR